jgi:hypothetical protein
MALLINKSSTALDVHLLLIILRRHERYQMRLQHYQKHSHIKLFNIFIVCSSLIYLFFICINSFIEENDCKQKTLKSINGSSALNLIEKTDVLYTLLTF